MKYRKTSKISVAGHYFECSFLRWGKFKTVLAVLTIEPMMIIQGIWQQQRKHFYLNFLCVIMATKDKNEIKFRLMD